MNFISFFGDLFHPKPKGKIKKPPRGDETTREAAAKALEKIFSSSRKSKK